jgi:hypothetical protein
MRIVLDICNFMVWLVLSGVSRVIPLAFVKVAAAIAWLVMAVLGEAVVFLVLLFGPLCHHVAQLHCSS